MAIQFQEELCSVHTHECFCRSLMLRTQSSSAHSLPLPSCQVSGFRIVLSMVVVVVVVWWRRLWVVLCQSFLVRHLVPETLREAPSSARLTASACHLRGQETKAGVRARKGLWWEAFSAARAGSGGERESTDSSILRACPTVPKYLTTTTLSRSKPGAPRLPSGLYSPAATRQRQDDISSQATNGHVPENSPRLTFKSW